MSITSLDLEAAELDLTVNQGQTFILTFTYRQPSLSPPTPGNPVDLTGFMARMQVRAKPLTSSPIIVDAATLTLPADMDGGVGNGYITLHGNSSPNVSVLIPAAVMEAIVITGSQAKLTWDFKLFDSSSPSLETFLMRGQFIVKPAVTHPT